MNGKPAVRIEAPMLTAAFPNAQRDAAERAVRKVIGSLDLEYWHGQFAAAVEGEMVFIPDRLHFVASCSLMSKGDHAWLLTRALKTRSTDGFLRQRALCDLLQNPQPWSAPFIVALIGGYVVEILDEIAQAMTPELEQILGAFITHNDVLWRTTKQRIVSYWNVYYRARWLPELNRAEQRDEYVGFRLMRQLEASASRSIFDAR